MLFRSQANQIAGSAQESKNEEWLPLGVFFVVAERIETREEVEALRSVGAAYGQGFFYGRPAPLGPPVLTLPEATRSETA